MARGVVRAGVTVVVDRARKVSEGLADLAATRVLVGYPEGQEERDDGSGLNNASLAYIHNYGAPEAGIPARNFMESGVERGKTPITEWLQAAARLALSGKPTVGAALTGAGLAAESAIKGTIASGIPPPLKAATVARRRKRSKGSDYRRKATKPEHVTPLIDTGAMQQAIVHVIERPTRGRGR